MSPKKIAIFIIALYLLIPSRFLAPAYLISAATELLAAATLTPAWMVFFPSAANGSVEPSCSDRELAHLQASAATSNLANINTTHSPEGGAYKKKIVVRHRDGKCEIQSVAAFRTLHEPGHPDADSEGFVNYPDISASEEMKHLSEAQEKIKKFRPTSKNGVQPEQSDIDVN